MAVRGTRLAAVLAVLVLVVVLGYWTVSQRSRIIFDGESTFGRVWVVERADGLRALYMGAGRGRQSALYPDRPMHLELAYTRLGMVGLALVPGDARILFVGLGGGAMPRYAHHLLPDAHIEVVEIDPLILHVAQQYFAFRPDPRLVVHTGDGRAFIEQAPPAAYDLIVLDAFSDDAIPFALTTRQFLEAVRSRLAPGGVVVSNLFGASGEYASMLATYAAVFDQIRLIRVGRGTQRILVAGPARPSLDRAGLVQASHELGQRAELGFDLPGLVERGYEGAPAVNPPLLEDSARSLSLALSLRTPAPARARARLGTTISRGGAEPAENNHYRSLANNAKDANNKNDQQPLGMSGSICFPRHAPRLCARLQTAAADPSQARDDRPAPAATVPVCWVFLCVLRASARDYERPVQIPRKLGMTAGRTTDPSQARDDSRANNRSLASSG
jgi:spermidine synthase